MSSLQTARRPSQGESEYVTHWPSVIAVYVVGAFAVISIAAVGLANWLSTSIDANAQADVQPRSSQRRPLARAVTRSDQPKPREESRGEEPRNQTNLAIPVPWSDAKETKYVFDSHLNASDSAEPKSEATQAEVGDEETSSSELAVATPDDAASRSPACPVAESAELAEHESPPEVEQLSPANELSHSPESLQSLLSQVPMLDLDAEPRAGHALAQRAMVDFSPDVRAQATNALAQRPQMQRHDFLVRTREVESPETAAAVPQESYPQRDAVLFALRKLAGEDAGNSSNQWRHWLADCKSQTAN